MNHRDTLSLKDVFIRFCARLLVPAHCSVGLFSCLFVTPVNLDPLMLSDECTSPLYCHEMRRTRGTGADESNRSRLLLNQDGCSNAVNLIKKIFHAVHTLEHFSLSHIINNKRQQSKKQKYVEIVTPITHVENLERYY